MLSFPNCKINLGLNILRKRSDGYHDLETVFYPIPLTDVLELVECDQPGFQLSGLKVEGNPDDNLCLKAYHLLKQDFPHLPAVSFHLLKAIPIGAGLGGGSADGAFMLKLLNQKFRLTLTEQQLIDYALQLGSDCPFFIVNKPSFATGRGEKIEPVELDLSPYKFVIVNPGIHISTKEAFSKLVPAVPAKCIKEIIQQPLTTWKNELVNDFEKPFFQLHPAIESIKTQLYNAGAVYASMTGSGSTVYGIFEKSTRISLSFPPGYLHMQLPAS